jgi:16S rRNA (cytosine967-C5)-methyltransferase
MKLYKNLVDAVARTVQEVFKEHRHADKALERLFKQNPRWGSRDRRFVAEGVYDIVRHYRLYATLAESENNYWFITAVWLVVKGIEIPEWPEFRHVNPDQIRQYEAQLKSNFVVSESVPDWVFDLLVKELTEPVAKTELLAMNTQAPVFLRVNTLKATADQCIAELAKDKILVEKVPGVPDALRLSKRENVFQSRLFKEGWFEVQDAGSQMIGLFLAPNPGETVIDACAGAGGKSLQLSALMKNKGRIISMDVEAWKLEELKKRSRRGNAHNIETRLIENKKTIKELENRADRILLDVPCSGLGVLKRNPDAKWKLSLESIDKTRQLQAEIINDYSSMLKVGGEMVYSTCSILPSENEQVVQNFLAGHSNFSLLEDQSLLPSNGFDGFYMARLKRTT